jgi:hypothetical protein
MKDWPEKQYLEPKTGGQTYLEWLYDDRARSTPTAPAPLGLDILRQGYKANAPIRSKLLSFARLYKRQGRKCLDRWHQLPPGVSWEAVEAALQGIITRGLV